MTTMTRFTKKQLIEHAQRHIAHDAWLKENFSDAHKTPVTVELARIALASLDAEPVAYIFKHPAGELFWSLTDESNKGQNDVMPVYAAPPVQETGIYKDVLNIIGLLENNEWAEHCASTVLGSLLESEITRLVGKEQLISVVPETLPCPVHLVPGLHLGKGCKTETLLIALQRRAEYYAGLDAMTPEERAKHYANIEAFKAMLPQPVPAASSESVSQSLTDALRDVIAERQRQVSVKGWTPEHDDTYTCGELSGAAISYIEPMEAVFYWPAEWHDDSFKPSDERRNLVKATALLLAEIERLDRISAASALSEVDRE